MFRHTALVLVTTAGSFALAFAQSSQKLLNYTTAAVPLKVALQQLSKQAGENLLAADDLASEPIVLRLQNVETQLALDKIADVMSAEWVKTDKGLELRRTQRIVDAINKRLADRNLQNITAALKRMEAIANEPALDSDSAKKIAATYARIVSDERNGAETGNSMILREPLSNQTADMRLLAKMLLAIGPARIAALPVGYHVFSFAPTPIQHSIEGVGQHLVETYLSDRNTLAHAIADAVRDDAGGGYLLESSIDTASTLAKGPVRPLLGIDVPPNYGGSSALLNVYDKDGSRVSSAFVDFSGFDYVGTLEKRAKGILADKADEGIHVSPVTAEFAKRNMHSEQVPGPMTAESLELLCHPEQHDPLSLAISEGLLGIAALANENVVATTADFGAAGSLRSIRNGVLSPSRFMSSLTEPTRNEVQEQDGWLTCKPSNPLSATLLRTERGTLGKFMRSLNEKSYASIEDWAAMAQGVPYPDTGYFVESYMSIWRGDPYMPNTNDWETLRLYGSLSQQQLLSLGQGSSLDFEALTDEQRQILCRMFYSAGHPNIVKLSQGLQADGTSLPVEQGLLAESTEAAPNGISAHALLTMRTTSKDQFFVTYEDPEVPKDSACDLYTLAFQIATTDVPAAKGGPPDASFKVASLKYGAQRLITFSLTITDALAMQPVLTERLPAGPSIPLEKLSNQLPPEVWSKLEKKVDEIRARMNRFKSGLPEQPQVAPPPPLRDDL